MAGKPQKLSEGQKNEVVRLFWKKLLTWVLILFAILGGLAGLSLWEIKEGVEAKVEELVASRFEEPQIQKVVRQVAAERASVLMTEQIMPDVNNFKGDIASVSNELQGKMSQMEVLISDANMALDEVKRLSDFSLLVTKASNDDRLSFEELQKIAMEEDSRFKQIAKQALTQIITDPQVSGFLTHPVKWEEYNVNPTEASLEDFTKVFGLVHPIYHPFIINSIWEQKRFPKVKKLDIIHQVITTTKSIRTLTKACKLMDEEAKLGLSVLGQRQYAEWWEKNRKSYNKNPEDRPTDSND